MSGNARSRRSASLTRLSLALLAGCARSLQQAHLAPIPAELSLRDGSQAESRSDYSTLTAADLDLPNLTSTLEAVRRLRPSFLRPSPRVMGVRAEVALYVNGLYNGDVSLLDGIPLREIRDIRYLHPAEAQFRFGLFCRCDGGALLVTMRRPADR
jgi:hypothetical protein